MAPGQTDGGARTARRQSSGDDRPDALSRYRQMLSIRRFEEMLLSRFEAGDLTGTIHTSIGQEAVAVAAMANLQPDDAVFSNHRCHAHYLAYGGDMRGLFLEILGDARGICRGVGGSQHLHSGRFYSNGILAGMVPVAAGAAFAKRIGDERGLVVCFLGDGAFGEGIVYETFNMASLWNLPIVFVVENNRYAQSTPIARHLAGELRLRPEAFGIETDDVESDDVAALERRFVRAFEHVRAGNGPFCQIVETYRLAPHSKGDDLRDPNEIDAWRKRDPLSLLAARIDPDRRAATAAAVAAEIDRACALPDERRHLPARDLNDVPARPRQPAEDASVWRTSGHGTTMAAYSAKTFAGLMEKNPDLHLLGADIADPYGGAFGLYRGLSSRFGDRVHTTPVSEAGIVGIANGMALAGLRPVVEIMFGDFTTLVADQLINHAAKFPAMYGDGRTVACPTIVRTPMGGRRGYGPTHSQSLEKLFFGVPGLYVAVADALHDQAQLWDRMIAANVAILFIENKQLYGQILPEIGETGIGAFEVTATGDMFPTSRLSLRGTARADAAIVAYGGMLDAAMDAAKRLFVDYELVADIVLPTILSPCPAAAIAGLLRAPRCLAVVEEGHLAHGFGAELIARLGELGSLPECISVRIGSSAIAIPSDSIAERTVLPDAGNIAERIANALLP